MSVIEIDGAQFALHAVEQGVSIVDDMPGMAGLLLVVRKLIDDGVGPQPILAGESVVLSQLASGWAVVDEDVDELANGFMNWMRLSGRRPDPTQAYLCSTTFDEHSLLVPTATLVRLVERVSAMTHASLDDTRPVRPSPPREVVDWDRLRAWSRVAAAVYARRVIEGKAGTLRLEALLDLRGLAQECDELEGDVFDPDVTTRALEARWHATRERTLRELEAAGIFKEELDHEDAMVLAKFPPLSALRDSALALRRYYGSSARRLRELGPPPESVLDARVSLDWFRWPSFDVPEGDLDEWLAACEEHLLRDPPSSSTGRRFVELRGQRREMRYRTEVRATPCVWRLDAIMP
jgi:hypothetical protein